MENTKTIYGIVELPDPVVCSADVLGCSIKIYIGGVSGSLMFPSLPVLPNIEDSKYLVAPGDAVRWYQEHDQTWGKIAMQPQGVSYVYKLLLCFDVVPSELYSIGSKIYSGFGSWYGYWFDHLYLQTKQLKHQEVYTKTKEDHLDLFYFGEKSENLRPYAAPPRQLYFNLPRESSALTLSDLTRISNLASEGAPPDAEFEFQLAAYRALGQGDYRKAIVESAVAAELYLAKKIIEKLKGENCLDIPRELKKNRMLGNLFKLAIIKNVDIPTEDWDFKADVIDPRNEVIHDADYANRDTAKKAVYAVDKLLKLPNL
ncbi:MAG: hypothetical protein ACN6Q5_09375 [Pseudomonas sp.]|uniref:hypothetical protein n=1 Tax=Pseudomonas sp. TaxID=306 RepID=UPI003D10DF49